ncbi:hypothetical protein O7626_14905 [Micromonospora sp. WMMD1102]|uniref:hypothetical protein n=1 Tax=Micromonospora sp. WMMD1102 TaxID=3016105 RepID=UPI00241514EA|nr:hypothetical protein [Micromonospora sp. WMMD1102]MDG4787204.1 hypothetical protein [Micromonospora sp. WMMD1102]
MPRSGFSTKAAPPSTPSPATYAAQASAAIADAGLNRDSGNPVVPAATFIVTRPPGRNRDITMSRPVRPSSCRPAAATARATRGERPSSRGPKALRLRPYARWSPMNTPRAVATTTSGRLGVRVRVNTPAARTAASDGMTGRTPSRLPRAASSG